MYGMVNKALEGMVVDQFGEEAWERIKAEAGADIDVFISNQGYPDAITYNLVAAASTVLNRPATELLEAFGVHWVVKTAREGYGELMEANGRTLREFLLNLPNFHARVSLIFPHLQPPRFVCTDVTDQSLRLHYYSHRAGLTPLVQGLLRGLGQMFSTPIHIEQEAERAAGAEHDIFRVSWERAAAA
ncbi:MAG TPA: heme NO-binding domain-containing protein [Candidatus Contendobacter sp.]|nr:heme NO-binding domain-containing protein [Candidatus Contendobacter sp.]HRZ23149.1 heme NO-binding domain-containing protein [Candidatus Contendobacter sp.]HRZ52715.1 heme NO-binding domain-containing protein [Candidatus Contendobacter sp.]